MDYELKYVIAIFFLVKIAALSPEFPISQEEEKKKPEQQHQQQQQQQSHGLGHHPPAASSAGGETPGPSVGGPYRGKHFGWGPGEEKSGERRRHGVKDMGRSNEIKENQSFDTCEHKIELLEGSSPKWRNIQRTLRWFDRFLSSNRSGMDLCGKRKPRERKYGKADELKNVFKRKKPRRGKPTGGAGEEKTPRREWAHRSWKIRSKKGREKVKSEWKGRRHERRKFHDSSGTSEINATADASALFEVEKTFLQRAGLVKSHGCWSTNPGSSKGGKNCAEAESKKAKEGSGGASSGPEGDRSGGSEPREPGRQVPKQKAKAWPHFVYHRVSSDFFHPGPAGHSHRQSAYVAISVATSSKPESADNNVG